ncbi:MAG: Flp pilus assembly protein CpaB [Dongiaceae bacterium]
MILVAIVLAAGAVMMARSWISGQIADRAPDDAPEITTTTVVVAAAPLRFGNKLAREHVKIVEWPAALVPEGTFKTIDEVVSGEPRVVLQSIEPNEPILVTKITGPGQRASLSTIISAGMRAMTIRVNDVLGVAGFVLPNDRVDLLLTREIISNQPITDVLLQNIKVLGIDQKADQPDEGTADVVKAVTIEVTVEQAQKITLASTVGTLSLALRDVENVASEPTRTISLRDLNVSETNITPAPVIAELEDDDDAGALAPPPTPVPTPTAVITEPADEFGSIGITRGTARQEYRVNSTGQVMP